MSLNSVEMREPSSNRTVSNSVYRGEAIPAGRMDHYYHAGLTEGNEDDELAAAIAASMAPIEQPSASTDGMLVFYMFV